MPAFVEIEKFRRQLAQLDGARFIAVAGDGKILSGSNPLEPEWEYDLAQERFVPASGAGNGDDRMATGAGDGEPSAVASRAVIGFAELALPASLAGRNSRATGRFPVTIRGQTYLYQNLKQALGATLLLLSEESGFLERLSKEQTRSRRLIAHRPEDLFDSPAMRKKALRYAANLENGWWMNTNNSESQVRMWLNIIARTANLSWNREIRLGF